MKKIIKGFICFVAIFALVGCGANNNNTNNSTNNIKNNTNSSTKKENDDKLEKFILSIKESIQNLSNSMYDADIIARDNSLVYVYTYKTTYDTETVKVLKTSLETAIQNQSSTFNSVLDSVRDVAPSTKAVIVEYYNGDNTLIASIEFK